MSDAVIVAGARTPIGRSNKGSLRDVDAFELAKVSIGATVERSGIPVADIEDLYLAEQLQGGGVIGRYVAVEMGLTTVPAMSGSRQCAGGLSTIQTASAHIRAGMNEVVIAGGTESLSSMPQVLKSVPASAMDPQPWMSLANPPTPEAPPWDMALTVGENTAREAGLTRTDVDEWAVRTHANAIDSIDNGYFEAEIVPVEITDAEGGKLLFTTDEHPRRGTTLEKLATLPVLHPELDNPTVTAGNAAGLNDCAATVMVTSDAYAKANGLAPMGRLHSWANVGVEPALTGLGPIGAIRKALSLGKLSMSDIAIFEVNEAFNSVPLAAAKELGIDHDILNVNGSGCSLGHPIAATGARMVLTMLNELERRGAQFGVVAMCAGGGMGSAAVIERL